MDEFDMIDYYFKKKTSTRTDVIMGIGDDGALLLTPKDQLLVVSVDTLVEGVHFISTANAYELGYKTLAVNLSDLAAMGAEPAWFTLALTMPSVNQPWLEDFSAGLFELANQFNMQLVGGDTTRGALTITIQVHGFVPRQQVLRRAGAQVGDKIYVSGFLGDAGLGLKVLTDNYSLSAESKQYVLQRLNMPTPKIALGILLREFASSAIDISDGLLADLGHLISSSQVGAEIKVPQLPLSFALQTISHREAVELALTAGDDYEICFTVSPHQEEKMLSRLKQAQIHSTCIGKITAGAGIKLLDYTFEMHRLGFQHF
jgi:thiamine-monophosphate kinase